VEQSAPAAPVAAKVEQPKRSRLARELTSVPNMISIVRIGLMYAGAILFVVGYPVAGVLSGVTAGLSDYLDGYIARRTGQVTELGAILDRLSDLVMETVSLVLAVYFHVISPIFIYVYLLREIVVLSARIYCAGLGVSVQSTIFGKLKSNFLGYANVPLFLGFAGIGSQISWLPDAMRDLAIFGICMGLFWGYWSGWSYLRAFAKAYNAADPQKSED
jgi:CDP-diacylglycerol--glycerol-3-phosphate 3-phosphatidyltransferase